MMITAKTVDRQKLSTAWWARVAKDRHLKWGAADRVGHFDTEAVWIPLRIACQ